MLAPCRRLGLSLMLAMFPALCLAAEEPAPNNAQEIRQGGYVEKLVPGADYKDRLPRIPPCEPAESLEKFHLIPGFRVEPAAHEQVIADPVDLCFDEHGRLFIAEMIPYAEGSSSEFGSPNGRVSMLEDLDGDGYFEKRTVYVDGLVWPTGIACYDGGIFITAAPDLLYCKDSDGDGRADLREVVLTGFDLSNPNALPNSLRFGLDGRIHGMTSTAGGMLKAVKWEQGAEGRAAEPVQARGRDFSVDPRTGELRLESGGSQFGMTFDDWGCKFESSNSAPIEMILYDDCYLARNPYLVARGARIPIWKHGSAIYRTSPLEPWRIVRTEMRIGGVFSGPVEGGGKAAGYFTGACGVYLYRGHAWPEEFYGNAFVCEGAGNLIHRMRLEPSGVGYTAHRTEEGREFLTSDEIWFRPIQFTDAPDGNLYFADMYRECYEHPDAVPPSVKKYLDLTSGCDRGRIYRIVYEGDRPPFEPIGSKPVEELVKLLAHPNGWHRDTARRLLYERRDRSAVEPLNRFSGDCEEPLGRFLAMFALAGQGALTEDVVLARLADRHPRVREGAVRLSETLLADSPKIRAALYAMAGDDDQRVRYQLAFTLGEMADSRATAALATVAMRDTADPWARLAVLSSCYGRAGELFTVLAGDLPWRATNNGRAFLAELGEQVGLQNREDQVVDVFRVLDGLPDAERQLARAIVEGLGRGLEKSNSPLRKRLESGSLAGQLMAEIVEKAKQMAADDGTPPDRRAEAVRSLAQASFDEVADTLAELLESRQPQKVQVAAIQTLNRFDESDVPEMILDVWPGFSPIVRNAAAEALFARPERLASLLAAIDAGIVMPSQLDPARIQFLLSHPDAAIRGRAEELLGGSKLARREEAVEAYRDTLAMKCDREAGKEVFKRECAICHRLEGVGYDLGLPLQTIQNRGREGILLNVLDPNREVNPTYLNYVIVTDAGLSITGMIAEETATSITLKRAEGESDTVLRTNIDEMLNTGVSIMPEGLEKQITKQEMADLIEYLMTVQ